MILDRLVAAIREANDAEQAARAALIALRDSVSSEGPVTAQIVRAYVDKVLGEKVSERG